ncbi:MAG: hypothetical protein DIU68_002455 [Chloroflexota bacterium]|nr:MAG: hypothetical protein DIU68_02815 [Chloroflexota bacterium]
MIASRSLLNRRRFALLLALIVCLASVYMVTYSGRIESGDSLYLFDGVSSFVQFGDLLLDESAGTRPLQTFEDVSFYPLPSVDVEPLQVILAAPLFALAQTLPGIGLVHSTWLFNILVIAVAAGVLFAYALALDYSERTAVASALIFGIATIVWPYSKSFFREPLALLLLLLAALFVERWRYSGYRSLGLLTLLLLAVAGMLLTKATTALALPGLLVLTLPSFRRANRRVFIAIILLLLLAAALFGALALYGDQLGIGQRYDLLSRFSGEWSRYGWQALHTYLLSFGGSIWGTSPITLLALPGLFLLARERRYRYLVAVPLIVLAFAVGYAFSSGAQWFGGLSWPPRFLVPVVPFLILAALPVIDRLTNPRTSTLWVLLFLLLLFYSLWVQFAGVSLPWGDYADALPPAANGLLEWSGGLNLVEYSRPVLIPQLWSKRPIDFAWTRVGVVWWPLAFGGLAVVAALVVWRAMPRSTHARPRGMPVLALLLPIAFVFLTYAGLRAIRHDPLYLPPDRPGLMPLLSILAQETDRHDLLLLSNREYENFFLNTPRDDEARVIGLGNQRGDRPSETQLPRVESNNPGERLATFVRPMLHSFADVRSRLWLLENKGPDFPWAVRPVEQFMSVNYYPIRVLMTDPPDPTVRLIEYSTVDAPDPYAFLNPETLTDLVFGDGFRLVGYTMPVGVSYFGGDVLPVSFMWQTDTPAEHDYRIAWFLRSADGAPIAQGWDSAPRGDFERTSEWPVGAPFWDNRAMRLPRTLAPGQYQMWVKVYYLDETLTPVDLPVSGSEVIDGVIGVLPTRIQVPG